WPGFSQAVVAVADLRKGEKLVLVTTRPGADRAQVAAFARANQVPELMVPKLVMGVAAVPLLGSGKTDYPALQHLVGEWLLSASVAAEVAGEEAGIA
ncbi:MAG: hypothetical protein HQL59_13765, partial [Magnetococcales bacterium]|nr:hypothetical protein [Magnetococcales bacterium]